MRILLCLLLCSLACTAEPDGMDAAPIDASRADAAMEDAGASGDAEARDADPGDAGAPNDVGPMDADPRDADPSDADPEDAAIDAGPSDAEPSDADPEDAAPEDALPSSIDGGFLPSFTQNPIDTSFLHGQSVTLVDIEDDGDLDILGSISLDDTVRLYLNDGDGSSWNTISVAQPGALVAMHSTAADLDGDGDLDVAAVGLFDRNIGFASEGEVTWYRNPGDPAGPWTEVPITGLTFWGPRTIAAGDLTGDGDPDLVVGALPTQDLNGGPQGNGVHWFRNTGGAFAGPTAIDAALERVDVVLIHDVDGDGVLDVIACGNLSDEIVWYENQRPPGMVQANPSFVRHTISSIPGPSGIALAQRDADPELELFATGDDGGGGLITWLDPPANPASPWSSNPVATNFGAGTTRLTAMDLNLDGRVDVAISSSDRVRAYVDDNGSWIQRTVADPHLGVDFVASGDIDGDGIPDLVTSTFDFDPGVVDRFDWWRTHP